MRVVVHDFAGHPFQAQLSRALAARGHQVVHRWSPDVTSGQGALERRDDDPDGLAFEPVAIGRPFERYRPVQRLRDERAYAGVLRAALEGEPPDVVLSGNAPITVQARLASWCLRHDVRFVFWLQDVLSVGTAAQLRRRLGVVGALPAGALQGLERRTLRRSDHVVQITDGFDALLDDWDVPRARRTVIENWTPLDDVAPRERDNAWAASQGLGGRPVLLYAGTLGLKHDPATLLSLARGVAGRADVVVVSEGIGADWLRDEAGELLGTTLRLLPFQPWEALPDVLGAADVLLALLEPDAGVFSVPSKVLTGHAAGRPQLAAIPAENLAARIIEREASGLVVPPGDHAAFVAAAEQLLDDPSRRDGMAAAARAYAERAFAIDGITDAFEEVLVSR